MDWNINDIDSVIVVQSLNKLNDDRTCLDLKRKSIKEEQCKYIKRRLPARFHCGTGDSAV